MGKIISIATSVPEFEYAQEDLMRFSDEIYSTNPEDSRKLKFLYQHSGIDKRYSVLPDFQAKNGKRKLFPDFKNQEPSPGIEKRLSIFNKEAADLCSVAIAKCINGHINLSEISHIITVSCTGMSAPGLDLQIVEKMNLSPEVQRFSINFMGCYAAVHALKLANSLCAENPAANVVIACVEFCTLHFQNSPTMDNITSSLLFGDGCAAVLVKGNNFEGVQLQNFHSMISYTGKNDMAWEIAANGFRMTLSSYVPDLLQKDFSSICNTALSKSGKTKDDVSYWCIHPGGRKILEGIAKSLNLKNNDLKHSFDILKQYGNMSSPTILFVLEEIMEELKMNNHPATIFGAAFGPGLTTETFTATYD